MKKTPTLALAAVPTLRCAIYTRKSTEEGLDQEFNSLDAQRESAEAYIASQQAEGWVCLPERFDDGGCTGANLDRPALQRLLAAIAAGQVDCVRQDLKPSPGACPLTSIRDPETIAPARRRHRSPGGEAPAFL